MSITPSSSLHTAWAKNVFYLWMRRRALFSVGVVGFVLSAVVAFTIPKQYESSTTLMPPESQGGSAALLAALAGTGSGGAGGLGMLASGLLGAKSNGELYIDLLHSGTVRGALAERFHLQQVYKKKYMQDTLKKLNSRTKIAENKKSGVITITVVDTDRQRAQDLARAYPEELNKLLSRVSISSARRERQFIEARQAIVLTQLTEAEEQMSRFSSSTSTIDIREQTRATVDAGAKLQGQLIFGESELEALKQVYGDENIRVKEARERVSVLQRELGRIGGTAETANQPLELSKDELYPPLRRLPELGVRYAAIYRRVKLLETVYELLSAQYETARIQEAKEIPTINTVDAAGYPERKTFPPRLILMLAGTFILLIAASILMLFHRNWVQLDQENDLKKLVGIFRPSSWTDRDDEVEA